MFYPRATLSFLALRGSILQRESGDEVCLRRVNFHSSFSSLSSLQFVLLFSFFFFFFFAARRFSHIPPPSHNKRGINSFCLFATHHSH